MMKKHFATLSFRPRILTILTQRRLQTLSSCNRSDIINQEHMEALSRPENRGTNLEGLLQFPDSSSGSPAFSSVDTGRHAQIQNSTHSVELPQNVRATFYRSYGENLPSGAPEEPITDSIHGKSTLQSHNCAVIDFSTAKSDIKEIKSYLKKLFPRLHLCVDHSEGKDIQDNKTHTISLYLSENIPGSALSAEETAALSKFKGDSIGIGYLSTLKRALKQACAASGLKLSPKYLNKDQVSSKSLLTLYLGILRRACTSMRTRLSYDTHEGEGRVKITIQDGEHQLASTHGSRHFTLSLLFEVVEAAAIKKDAVGAARIAQRIVNSPPVIVLPDQHIRIKQVLRFLLNYHYGVPKDHIFFETQVLTGFLYHCDVVVKIPAHIIATDYDRLRNPPTEASEERFVLGSCVGHGRKLSERLACVLILEKHFSTIFNEQLAFHPKFKELVEQAKQVQSTTAVPHLSQGLGQLLEWALHREGKRFEVVFRCLQSNTTYNDIRAHARFMCWRTCISFLNGNDNELVAVAYDIKKKRSEQKAIASALAKRFGGVCTEGIAHAQSQNLIDTDGSPTPCEGLDLNIKLNEEEGDLDDLSYTDPFMDQIKFLPVQDLIALPPPPESSLLSLFRQLCQAYAQHSAKVTLAGPVSPTAGLYVHEEVEWDEKKTLWVASLYTVGGLQPHGPATTPGTDFDTAENTSSSCWTLVSTSTSRIRVCALLQMFGNWFKKMVEGHCSEADMSFFESQTTQETISSMKALIRTLPEVLPEGKIVEPVLTALGKLYGVRVQMRMSTQMQRATVKFWGRAAEPFGFENEDNAPVVDKMGEDEAASCDAGIQTGYYVFLGQRSCSSIAKAVIQCCHNMHAEHISLWFGTFSKFQLHTSQFELVVGEQSKLAELVNAVATEIKLTSHDTVCAAKLIVHYNRFIKEKFKVDFSIFSKEKEVVMETVQANDFLSALLILCRNISVETGKHFEVTGTKNSMLVSSFTVKTLKKLCGETLGLPLKLETVLAEGEWHCTIDLELDLRRRYRLVFASATRKKEAMVKAASEALRAYFWAGEEGGAAFENFASLQGNYLYVVD